MTTRNLSRAVSVAERVGGEALPFERFRDELANVDVVISSTAAPHVLLERDEVAELIRRRRKGS